MPDAELQKLFSSRIEEIFKSTEGFQDYITKAYGVEPDKTLAIVKRFDELLAKEATLHPRASATLEELSKSYSLVICSDTTGSTRHMLEKAGLRRFFQKEFYSNEMHMTKMGGLFDLILRSYPSTSPNEFVSIGDSASSDIAIPKRIGMRTIWIKNEALGPCPVDPDHAVEDLSQVVRAVSLL